MGGGWWGGVHSIFAFKIELRYQRDRSIFGGGGANFATKRSGGQVVTCPFATLANNNVMLGDRVAFKANAKPALHSRHNC